ncbi:hypothetical protein BCR34DRAFT_564301 [Clohesyomyces aquaticus]|uniref:Secreted protein n=1 Tax=Clohesyomyces aquaticus TaxID=1231657 RepID=A0A1Y1ZPJ9_9PLEO|nr:hypothetical protein BCR34DRAFT_564301 [Clohesyomyces aquaticus]
MSRGSVSRLLISIHIVRVISAHTSSILIAQTNPQPFQSRTTCSSPHFLFDSPSARYPTCPANLYARTLQILSYRTYRTSVIRICSLHSINY